MSGFSLSMFDSIVEPQRPVETTKTPGRAVRPSAVMSKLLPPRPCQFAAAMARITDEDRLVARTRAGYTLAASTYSRAMTDTARSSAPLIAADAARAADADREAVAERLRIAAGDGRIDLVELEERLGKAYAAKTYGQLEVLVADLPVHAPSITPADALPEPETLVLKTKAPNLKQSGQWAVPRHITAQSTTGIITIDFTQASCAHREVVVEAVTGTGWVRIWLPDGWAARISPSSTNTSHIHNKAAETAEPGAPTIIVTGHPVHGYIKIKHRRRRRR
jgi:hypothetical protein